MILLLTIKTTFGQLAQTYFELGVGIAPWHESHVKGATSQKFPIQPYVEYGKFLDAFSLTLLYDFRSNYRIDNYELNPVFIGLFLNGSFLTIESGSSDIEVGASGGFLIAKSTLQDKGNSNIPGYTLEKEIESGIGYGARAYVKLVFGSLVFTPQIQLFRSNQDFIAGQFNKQKFQTGSNRLIISIGYKFNNNRYEKVPCPTYF